MTTVYKVLGQSAPTTNSIVDLYTVPVGNTTVCSTLVVANRSNTTPFRIAVRPSGDTLTNSHYIVYDNYVNQYDSVFLTLGLTLSPTDVISVQAGQANTLTFSLFGSEMSVDTVRTIYVDSVAGSDSNSGLTAITPVKTFSQAMSLVNAGERIYLKRGSTWFEQLNASKSNITIAPYGTGSNPIINGGIRLRHGILITASNVTVSDIDVRGAINGIYVYGSGASASIYNGVISGNYYGIVAGAGTAGGFGNIDAGGRLIIVSGTQCINNNLGGVNDGDGIQISEDASNGVHTIVNVVCTYNSAGGINHKCGTLNLSGSYLAENGGVGLLGQVHAIAINATQNIIERNNKSDGGIFNVALENKVEYRSYRNIYRDPYGGANFTNNINIARGSSGYNAVPKFWSNSDIYIGRSGLANSANVLSMIRVNTTTYPNGSIDIRHCSFFQNTGTSPVVDVYGATGLPTFTMKNCAFWTYQQRNVRIPDIVPLDIDGNNYFRADGNEFFEIQDARYYFTIANLRTNESGQEASGNSVNPQFNGNVTVSTPNLTPNVGSPLIGRGITTAGVTYDFHGNPFTSPPNIGAIA